MGGNVVLPAEIAGFFASTEAQPTRVSILDCSQGAEILKQNVSYLPDWDWQGHTATIDITAYNWNTSKLDPFVQKNFKLKKFLAIAFGQHDIYYVVKYSIPEPFLQKGFRVRMPKRALERENNHGFIDY